MFLPAYAKIREIIESGTIGKVSFVRAEYGFLSAGARRARS